MKQFLYQQITIQMCIHLNSSDDDGGGCGKKKATIWGIHARLYIVSEAMLAPANDWLGYISEAAICMQSREQCLPFRESIYRPAAFSLSLSLLLER